jgi:beta-glucanase (GH16 family)
MLRRCAAVLTPLVAVGLAAAFASARPVALAGAPTRAVKIDAATVTVSKPVTVAGDYLVLVSVKARTRVEKVTVYLAGQRGRKVNAHKHGYTTLSYRLTLAAKTKKLTARAVSPKPKVHLAMTLKREISKSTSTGTATSASTTPPPAAPVPAPSTGSTTSTPPPAIPPQAPDPYTHLVYDTTTGLGGGSFSGTPGTAPAGWTYDDQGQPGECGTGVENTNTNSTANAAVDGNGDLAITALPNGQTSQYPYTSAQLTSAYSFEYGSAQAKIQLPAGLGLCSSFWMVGDPTGGDPDGDYNLDGGPGTRTSFDCHPQPEDVACGEIDALEAPSFGGTGNPNNFGYPAWAIFTLHGATGAQQFETGVNSLGNLSAGPHVYGVIWSPNSIVWTIDGVAYASATPSSMSNGGVWDYNDHDFHLILDLAVGGWPCQLQTSAIGSYPNCPTDAAGAKMLIDWVKVYQ